MIYSHAYVVWPIIIIHGHHGYFGKDNVKYYCQKKMQLIQYLMKEN